MFGASGGGLGKELNRYGNQKEDRVSYRRLENSNGLPVQSLGFRGLGFTEGSLRDDSILHCHKTLVEVSDRGRYRAGVVVVRCPW